MTQVRLIQIGNSLGVVLPRETLSKLGLKKGDALAIRDEDGEVTLSPYDPTVARQMSHVEDGIRHYRDALKELSK